MTGSRVRKFLSAAALGALMLPAAAQWVDHKPPVLGPGDYPPEATQDPPDKAPATQAAKPAPGAQTAPDKAAPDQDGATGAPRSLGEPTPANQTDAPYVPPPSGAIVQPAPVEVDALGTAEGPPVGTLDATNGGFGDHLWSGSDRGKTETLLARAPIVSGDPVLRDLVRRTVLTRAAAPPGQAKKAFVTMRIERLLDAGLVKEAGALAAQAAVPNDEEFARLQATAILLASRAADACGPATALRQTAGEVFWLQLRAYCADAAGDSATADITKAVLKAQGHYDPAYETLVEDVLTKKQLAPGAIANPTAIHIFLIQQAGLPVTDPVARKMGTAENLLVARDSRNSPRARFEAAERIVATGALSAPDLIKIADAQDLPLNRLANAAAEAPNLPFFMGQVVLRRAAAIETRPEENARLAALALTLGEKAKQSPLAAALEADVIASLKPTPVTREHARSFARALILAGRSDLAGRWTQGDVVMKVVAAFATQDPARLAAVQSDLSAFAASLIKTPPAPDADRSYKVLVLGLADVLGFTMPADAKAAAISLESNTWDGERPGPGQMRTIHELARSPERRGEAVLMITGAIQTFGLKDLAPDVTIAFVRLLTQINEPAAARSLALEAMAEYVPPPLPPAPPPAAATR